MNTSVNQHGFLFQIQVAKVAKQLNAFGEKNVTVPAIVDSIYEDVSGDERTKASQRVRMFLRMLEDNGVCTRFGSGDETYYKIQFDKISI